MPGLGGVQTFVTPPGWVDPHNWTPIDVPVPKPLDFGALAWSYDPAGVISTNGQSMVNGTIYLTQVVLPVSAVVSNILWQMKTAAVGSTAGQNFVGISTQTGALMVSAGIDAAQTQTGLIVTPVGPVPLQAGSYWVGWVVNAATTPPFLQNSVPNGATNGMGLGAPATLARFATNATGQTSLPVTIDPTVNLRTAGGIWAALS